MSKAQSEYLATLDAALRRAHQAARDLNARVSEREEWIRVLERNAALSDERVRDLAAALRQARGALSYAAHGREFYKNEAAVRDAAIERASAMLLSVPPDEAEQEEALNAEVAAAERKAGWDPRP